MARVRRLFFRLALVGPWGCPVVDGEGAEGVDLRLAAEEDGGEEFEAVRRESVLLGVGGLGGEEDGPKGAAAGHGDF